MSNMLAPELITGLILAGGRATRMGQVDKGLQLFNGMPLVAHVIDRLKPQVGALAININRNEALYAGHGLPLWPDLIDDYAGPLAGLQTGLSHCTTPYLLSVPCDSPFLPRDLVARLSEALLAADAELAMAVTDGVEATATADNAMQRQSHPVFCLLKTTLLSQLNTYMDGGGRKMQSWMKSLAMVEVPFEHAAAFSNINTLQELQQFERHPP
jgi:molybdenum cofactor guanylyltransferase